jgi:hypothetical protein
MTLIALLSSVAFAQTTVATGSIVGTVTDPSGAVISGAKVTITHTATGQVITLTTNSSGAFSSGALAPGDYKALASSKGFSTVSQLITVQVNSSASFNPKLQLGQESQVIEVQASAVQVNTEQAEVQGVVTSGQIENLPVNGRNFLDLAQLEPGVQIQDGANFDPTKVGYSSISFGSRFGRTARINVDGTDVSDETVGTTTEDIPASSIQEFSLAQSSLDLSNDLTSSGAVNVTTKSGTNAYHGEAFGVYRDSTVGAAALPSPSASISTPYQRNQEGANFGGPIIKDKLFFFLDGERTLQHLAAPVLEGDPFTSYSGTFPSPFKEEELMGRADYSLTKTARLFYRYNYFQNKVYATYFPSSYQIYQNKDYTRNSVVGLDFNTGSFTHTIRFSYLKFQNEIQDAARGSCAPSCLLADYPVSINIGGFTVGPNLLAPQSTPQSDHQLKYDGSKIIGKHIIRFGFGWNHIQGGGFASFFKIDPQVYGDTPVPSTMTDPTQDTMSQVQIGNGQGFSTTQAAFGFPAGGLGPDNRMSLYFGDAWKVRKNLTVAAGLRWERDTGRTDSDMGAIVPLNQAFPGYGNPVKQPNKNFAPQLGIAWDPKGNGKTSFRGGIGLYYENVIFNNVLFDRPLREQTGAFLQTPNACLGGAAQQVLVPVTPTNPTGIIELGTDPVTNQNYCMDTIGQAASALAAFQTLYQTDTPFSLTAANPSYLGNYLSSGLNTPLGLFAPNYKSPRSVQINFGVQRELHRGLIFSADYLRNVETHALLGVDINHTGSASAKYFNLASAQAAITNTVGACENGNTLAGVILPQGCPGLHPAVPATATTPYVPPGPATIADFAAFGLASPADVGSSCFDAVTPGPLGDTSPLGPPGTPLGYGCAFGGINPNYGQMLEMEPISRSVFNALQMKLSQNVANPIRGVKSSNFQVSYQLSRFINPLAFQGNYAPSNPTSANDQDFVLQAADNDNPLKYMGPSLLDRTHQISFGGSFELPYGFHLGLMSHFYSPLSSPVIVGDTGVSGQIFQTDFTGNGFWSDPMPGTKNGSFERNFGLAGLNAAINNYNTTVAGQPTPAGQVLVANNLFTPTQLATIGAVAPSLSPAPSNQLLFPWLKAFDFNAKWDYTIHERFTIEPSVGIFNLFNFANFNLPPGAMTGWVNEGGGSINSVQKGTASAGPFRVGAGTGVFALGAPRAMEWGLRVIF